MPIPRKRRQQGPSGHGTVKVLSKMVRVDLDEGGSFDIPKSNAPDYLIDNVKDTKVRRFDIGLSSDTTRLSKLSPLNGSFVVGFLGFSRGGRGPESPPIPKTGTGKYGEYRHMSALLQILMNADNGFKGMRTYGWLHYKFAEAEEDGEIVAATWGHGIQSTRLNGFLQGIGLDFEVDSIPWSDNTLPFIEDEGVERAVPFTIKMKDGWVEEYSVLPKELAGNARKALRKALKDRQEWIDEQANK